MSQKSARLTAGLVVTMLVSACGGATASPSTQHSAISTARPTAAATATIAPAPSPSPSPSPTMTVSEAAADYLAIAKEADGQLTTLGFWSTKASKPRTDREEAQIALAAL